MPETDFQALNAIANRVFKELKPVLNIIKMNVKLKTGFVALISEYLKMIFVNKLNLYQA